MTALRNWNTGAATWNMIGNYIGNGRMHCRGKKKNVKFVGWIIACLTNQRNPFIVKIESNGESDLKWIKDSKEVGSGQAMPGLVTCVKKIIRLNHKKRCEATDMSWAGKCCPDLCFERLTLAAKWRVGGSGAAVNRGRPAGAYSGDEEQMMATDLGDNKSDGEKYTNLKIFKG